jgi:hypothetical protein
MPTLVAGAPAVMIGDGSAYSLSISSSYYPPEASNLDKVTIAAGSGPLADWIDEALNRLERCWTSR